MFSSTAARPLVAYGFWLAAQAVSATAALADDECRDAPLLTGCDLESDQVTLPFPMETRSLAVHWKLRDDNHGESLALYVKLVERSGFHMPDEPALMMYIVHLASPYETAPGHITRYDEGNLMMRVKLKQAGYEEEDGWYNMYMPVNDFGAYESGIEWGYPKYLASVDFEFAPAEGTPDTGVVTTTLDDGRVTTRIEWTRDPSAPYSDELDGVTRFADFHYSQALSHRGPERVRSRLSPTNSMAPPGQDVSGLPEPGWGRITMDPYPQSWDAFTPTQIGPLFQGGESLHTLVNFDEIVPVSYYHQQHLLVYTIDSMGIPDDWTPPPGTSADADGDTVPNAFDNCPETYNRYQLDGDHDAVGDACDDDNTLADLETQCLQFEADMPAFPMQDGFCGLPMRSADDILFAGLVENFCTTFVGTPGADALCVDKDGDGIYNRIDNCPGTANEDQADLDGDGIGDGCDWRDDRDDDLDGTVNADDNCPSVINYGQHDSDSDGVGDACANSRGQAPRAPRASAGGSGTAGGPMLILLLLLAGRRRRPATLAGRTYAKASVSSRAPAHRGESAGGGQSPRHTHRAPAPRARRNRPNS